MTNIFVVDYPVFAAGLLLFLRNHFGGNIGAISTDTAKDVPPDSLLLIELFLPEGQCGFELVQQLQQTRPDLTPILWTTGPAGLYTWAALECKLPGLLDKTMPLPTLIRWLNHAREYGTAWPRWLLLEADHWGSNEALRLRSLSQEHWELWNALLSEKNTIELAMELNWSKRTIERRLSELYIVLGVQTRSAAVNVAWKWGLVWPDEEDADLLSLVGWVSLSGAICGRSANLGEHNTTTRVQRIEQMRNGYSGNSTSVQSVS